MQLPLENLTQQEPKLLDQVRGEIRLKHYSISTEQCLHIQERHEGDIKQYFGTVFIVYAKCLRT